MKSNADVLVIGGGFAGLSTAYFLSQNKKLRVSVIERESKLGGHASGRNAGMIRQALSDPVLVRLAGEGREFLKNLSRAGWPEIRYRENGSLLTASGSEIAELRQIHKALAGRHIRSLWLTHAQAAARVSVLKNARFEIGLFCPSDAMVDIHGLVRAFLKMLKRQRASVICGEKLVSLRPAGNGFEVKTPHHVFTAGQVVNAAGAWAGLVGKSAGLHAIPFKAYRRHLFYSDPVKGFRTTWPFVWDLSHNVYFRPQGGQLMLSPCDKFFFKLAAEKKSRYGPDPKMRELLLKKINRFAEGFGRLKIRTQVAGLRTLVPDGRFVIGEDPKLKNFFWVAALGGHGVTTAFSVGKMASNLILGKKVDNSLQKAFSPKRFSK